MALLEKGDLVAGKYRVERIIGAGGMGQVVAARHVELGNLFAIKVLRPTDGDEQSSIRFLREVQAIARLQNDHVVRIHDYGETERGLSYMVMEHLDGQDLGALLAARGPLPVDEAVGAILEACEGLAEAHALGIVHRDLKPQNLFLARKSASGEAAVKIVDFGLAKSTRSAGAGNILSAKATHTGEIVGTGGYIAPEQISGEATTRSDVWALGVCLYRLLTGKHPFAGKNAVELSVAALTADFRPISLFREDVPEVIEAVIARCLRKIPDERYADARALGDALLDAFAVNKSSVPPSHTAATLTRATPRSAASIVDARDTLDGEKTIVTPPRPEWEPSAAPTMTFTTSEQGLGGLDRRSRLMLLWSGIALTAAILFLFAAVAWRRAGVESRRERETQARESQAHVPPPIPTPVAVPAPAPAPLPPTDIPVQAATPPPSAAPLPEPAVSIAVAPVETTAPAPSPEPTGTPAPIAEPVAAPVAAPLPAVKKPPKKKALYDTP